uniref:Uncharacterized protein n=1 Tax=Utricularia reniformis TaxID=192314 RepID=A0A1Y0B3M5_9LAMI|nr:hypothetical protein AEK19_MT1823 [Utricularia reniformis]ART31994.1 hypothetical protein AEK19_MT1823 [Utricularia reniformis]
MDSYLVPPQLLSFRNPLLQYPPQLAATDLRVACGSSILEIS